MRHEARGPSISIVVTTYEWPEALDLVLRALSEQTDSAFEIVVADDGSGPRTHATIRRWQRAAFRDRLEHVRHDDDGFRKARVANLAALRAAGDYVVFLDGDCIPRVGFVSAVRRAALPGWFLSTKRVHLDKDFSARVVGDTLAIWRWTALEWMVRGRGVARRPGFYAPLRDRRRPWRSDLPDFVPRDNGWGAFIGVSLENLWQVQGWDMRFTGWGCEDVDLVTRLRNLGLRPGWPGPRATLLHLWHPRAEVRGTTRFRFNKELLRATQASDRVEAVCGFATLTERVRQ